MSFYTNREIFYVPIWVQCIWDPNYSTLKSAAQTIQRAYLMYRKRKADRSLLLKRSYFNKSWRYPKKKRRRKKSKMTWYEDVGGRGTLDQAFRCARSNNIACFTFVDVHATSHYFRYKKIKDYKLGNKWVYVKEWVRLKSVDKYGVIKSY